MNVHMKFARDFFREFLCILCYIQGFFIFQVCDVQTRDHPQEDLAKFGYRKYGF
jgi:hypothetical protein